MSDPRGCWSWRVLVALVALLVVQSLTALPIAQALPPSSAEPAAAVVNGAAPALQAQEDLLQRVVELTNQERAKHGLPALTIDPALNR